MTQSPSALAGIRVLDLTRALAGPWCTQNLADLGAEVIKVERPEHGDESRAWGPPWMQDNAGRQSTQSSYFLCCNRNKKSITVDIAAPVGQAEIRNLVTTTDVLIENYKVGQLRKYGLDYASLKQVNPGLIYCSITGFGQNGPWAHRPGYDFVSQGMSGFLSVTGERDGVPGAGPQKAGIGIADLFTGMYSALAVLAALHHRLRCGEGQYIDISLLDSMVAAMSNVNTAYLSNGVVPTRCGNAHHSIVPYGVFVTADDHVIIGIGNDAQYRKFCEAAGRPDLATDPRFLTNSQRVQQREVLVPIVEELVKQRTRAEWIERLEANGVPCAPINNVHEALNNPQIEARGLRVDMPHSTGSIAKLVGSPMNLSASPVSYRQAPPLLGEHNEEILGRP
ncbi:MAG: CoA transferase [Gammaproteobacteria bacterium]|jgi:formyl-CoA transferase|nr:CoA transferase [Gammaproteobacteria bacterium]